ncbi:hypothetical protein CMV_003147 [Castanea mollissima]|uniref:Uncharacterized protein n=1 Tax=Castanea mollissima TaxID=60419 RepID=A0A8J4RUY1_9ROSI|nr:hypothetical protein CMV_003147 [Castanea mollissima]
MLKIYLYQSQLAVLQNCAKTECTSIIDRVTLRRRSPEPRQNPHISHFRSPDLHSLRENERNPSRSGWTMWKPDRIKVLGSGLRRARHRPYWPLHREL